MTNLNSSLSLSPSALKKGWQIVKFDEIATEVKSTTKTAIEDGLEFYVGLEHLDPQSLRIQRKGIIAEDNPSFTRLFKPGQILFGKRRCYQKKAAVADFEGICSGDIIVMEAVPGKIIPALLPFIVQSDMFFDWAERTSSGSLSPRTKWKALVEFEFPLPPLERQKVILEVLEKAVSSNMKKETLLNSAYQLLKSFFSKKLGVNNRDIKTICKNNEWNLQPVGKVLNILNNKRKPLSSSVRSSMQGKFPYYGPTGILDYIDKYKYDGTFALIGEDGDHFLKWRTQPMTQLVSGKFNVNNHAHVIKGTNICSIYWFYYYFYYQSIEKYLTRQGAGRYKLTKGTLINIKIPVPSNTEQKILCNAAKELIEQIKYLSGELTRSKQLLTKLASTLLAGGGE